MLAERRFVVSITDEGIGMDDQRLAAANALLQSPPPPGLSLSRTLGLHVVAHLANRYGVRVQLRRSATNGVTAIVALPATVLTRIAEPGPQPLPATMPPVQTTPSVPTASFVASVPMAPAPAAPPTPPAFAAYAAPPPAAFAPAPAPEPWVAGEPEIVLPTSPEVAVPPAPPAAPFTTAPAAEFTAPPAAEPTPAWDPPAVPLDLAGAAGAPPEVPPITVEERRSAWPEPEVVPPAFDPVSPVPPAAVPVTPEPARAGFDAEPSDLPRRAPAGTPLGADPGGSTLPQRDPGNHLSHRPDVSAPVPGEYDARPRPERVHDLLTRHLRGIRDGRTEDAAAGVTGTPGDTEDTP
jgi:hypothetical protein